VLVTAGDEVGDQKRYALALLHVAEQLETLPVRCLELSDRLLTVQSNRLVRLAAMLAGEAAAQRIQLDIEYSPEPPFDSGTPAHAPAPIVNASRERSSRLTAARLDSAQRAATRL